MQLQFKRRSQTLALVQTYASVTYAKYQKLMKQNCLIYLYDQEIYYLLNCVIGLNLFNFNIVLINYHQTIFYKIFRF